MPPAAMKKHLLIAGFVALGIALTGILLWKGNALRSATGSSGGKGNVEAASAERKGAGSAAVASETGEMLSKLPSRAMTKPEILALLNEVAEVLRTGDPAASKQALARLDEVFAGRNH